MQYCLARALVKGGRAPTTGGTKAAQDCRTPKRKRLRERLLPPKVLECGSPVPLWFLEERGPELKRKAAVYGCARAPVEAQNSIARNAPCRLICRRCDEPG